MLSSSQKQRIMLKSILLDGKSLQEAALWAKIRENILFGEALLFALRVHMNHNKHSYYVVLYINIF